MDVRQMKLFVFSRKGGNQGSAHKVDEIVNRFISEARGFGHEVVHCEDATNLQGYTLNAFSFGIVFGGDGTMVSVCRDVAGLIPILGINLGNLGFITDISASTSTQDIIELLEKGSFDSEYRALLSCEFNHKYPDNQEPHNHSGRALNDIVISRNTGKSLEFAVDINGKFAYKCRGDGVIISTPTGSTAYAMSAGGSIIDPASEVFEIIPMFPQTLSCRPLIISDESNIKITLTHGSADVFYDGILLHGDMREGDWVCIRKYHKTTRLIHPKNYDFYNTLREKLGWQQVLGTPR
jgi:NAD+ kinase